jgi:hypothetical protein
MNTTRHEHRRDPRQPPPTEREAVADPTPRPSPAQADTERDDRYDNVPCTD